MNRSKEAQILKYGGVEGYRAEMRRRRQLVKKPGFAGMDKEKVREAARKSVRVRQENAKNNKLKAQDAAQSDN